MEDGQDNSDDNIGSILDTLAEQWKQQHGDVIPSTSFQDTKAFIGSPVLAQVEKSFQQDNFQGVLLSLLKDFVKPELSAYKNAQLTDQGTKRIRQLPPDAVEEVNPPSDVINVVDWVSKHIEKPTIQANWHLLVPPILILLDSSYAHTRSRATVILSQILDRIDSSILQSTGLAEVLWSAITPNFSSLPPVIEIDVSVRLLRITYTTLVQLARLWHPSLPKRMSLLDKVVRDGFIHGMLLGGDKLAVAEVQLKSLDLLVKEMGIYFVKHLKYVIPVISSILADPLGSNHPPQLLLALQVLEQIISVCWPRIPNHHAEILRGTTTCWRYLNNQDSPTLIPVRDALKRVTAAVGATSSEARIDIKAIAAINPYYAELC